jgi:epoxyqueuosine reductase
VAPGGGNATQTGRCGRCRRCLDACPTSALSIEHGLDARRCISNWTLERRGDLSLAPDDVRALGNRVAGCDICQDVCPFNAKARGVILPEFDDEKNNAARLTSWEDILSETEDEYRTRVRRSALKRIKPGEFLRNVALALASCVRDIDEERKNALTERVRSRLSIEKNETAKKALVYCLAHLEETVGTPDR